MVAVQSPADEVISEVLGQVGCLTLNRPKALNALSLGMVRTITQSLLAWEQDPAVQAVAMRGMGRAGPFGVFSAGGDIRFFHQAALAGNPELEDFFTEEYALNHLIHSYAKPTISFMDGVVIGGGMGLCQGSTHRLVTENTRISMPETHIGLFPDVGGGYFLSRTPGHHGEWLSLTGEAIGGAAAISLGLADNFIDAASQQAAWNALGALDLRQTHALASWIAAYSIATPAYSTGVEGQIDHVFAMNSLPDMVLALESDTSPWAQDTLAQLAKSSPLMLHVTLEHIRRARNMSLADDLRMERDMVRRCFTLRPGAASETVEGMRALAVDKDRSPKWNPVRVQDVTSTMVAPFFESPWPAHAHPLRALN